MLNSSKTYRDTDKVVESFYKYMCQLGEDKVKKEYYGVGNGGDSSDYNIICDLWEFYCNPSKCLPKECFEKIEQNLKTLLAKNIYYVKNRESRF